MKIIYITLLLFFHNISSKYYKIENPYNLAPTLVRNITSYLENVSFDNATTLVSLLKNNFKWMDTIECTILPHSCRINFTLDEPYCALNNTHYVTVTGKIFPKEIIQEYIYYTLPVIVCKNCTECPVTWGAELSLIPLQWFEKYTIEYRNKDTIILRDHTTSCFPIITSFEKKITPEIADYCHYIHKKISQTYTNKKKKKYALDVRFDKQIVLRPQEDIENEQSFSS